MPGNSVGRLGPFGAGALLGALAAALYLAVLTGSPGALILAYLAQLPLFAAGLWLGLSAAVAAGTTATLAVLAVDGVIAATLFGALYAAPVILLARQALLARSGPEGVLEWYPPGLLVTWLTALGLAVMGAIVVLLGGAGSIETLLRETLTPALDRFVDEGGSKREAFIGALALITPGAIAASWMVMTASNAILAQGVLARFAAAWRPSPDIAALVLPAWLSALLAVAAISTGFGGAARFFGVNVMIVLSIPFCLAGLAVLHIAARRLARPHLVLVIFYVIAGLFGWPLLIVAILGAIAAPLHLRRRFAPPRSIGGNIDD